MVTWTIDSSFGGAVGSAEIGTFGSTYGVIRGFTTIVAGVITEGTRRARASG
jgi:hypothetical protein